MEANIKTNTGISSLSRQTVCTTKEQQELNSIDCVTVSSGKYSFTDESNHASALSSGDIKYNCPKDFIFTNVQDSLAIASQQVLVDLFNSIRLAIMLEHERSLQPSASASKSCTITPTTTLKVIQTVAILQECLYVNLECSKLSYSIDTICALNSKNLVSFPLRGESLTYNAMSNKNNFRKLGSMTCVADNPEELNHIVLHLLFPKLFSSHTCSRLHSAHRYLCLGNLYYTHLMIASVFRLLPPTGLDRLPVPSRHRLLDIDSVIPSVSIFHHQTCALKSFLRP